MQVDLAGLVFILSLAKSMRSILNLLHMDHLEGQNHQHLVHCINI